MSDHNKRDKPPQRHRTEIVQYEGHLVVHRGHGLNQNRIDDTRDVVGPGLKKTVLRLNSRGDDSTQYHMLTAGRWPWLASLARAARRTKLEKTAMRTAMMSDEINDCERGQGQPPWDETAIQSGKTPSQRTHIAEEVPQDSQVRSLIRRHFSCDRRTAVLSHALHVLRPNHF